MKKLSTYLPLFALTLVLGFSTHAMGVIVDAKAVLKGAYDINDSLMRDDLRVQNVLPLLEPYSSYGYAIDNAGTNADPSVFAISGSDAIVDWVVVELRSAADASVVIERRVALLQRDGDIVNSQGNTPQFAAPNGKYHVLIDYKNHLPIMSLRPLDGTNGTITFDSTDLGVQIFASDDHAGSIQIDSKRALRQGDINGDNLIKYVGTDNDRDPILSFVQDCDETALLVPGQGSNRSEEQGEKELREEKNEKSMDSNKKETARDARQAKEERINEKNKGEGSVKSGGGGGSIPTKVCDGYYRLDLNVDGQVKYTGFGNDRDLVLSAIGGSVPTNIVVGELPEMQTDTTLPSNPVPAVASILSPTSIQFDWAPSTDNTFGLAGYLVLRDGVEIAYVKAPDTFFTDTTVLAGPTYTYDVYALDYGLNESAIAGSDTTATGVAPTAADDTLPNVVEGQSVSFNLFANDDLQGATMSQAPNPNPLVGDFGPVNTVTGVIGFNSYAGSAGTHTFSYTIQNGFGSSSANITVTIDPIPTNDPPTANDDSITMNQDTVSTFSHITFTGDDTDPESDTLTLSNVHSISDQNNNGTPDLSISIGYAPDQLVITPEPGFSGITYFNYVIEDEATPTPNNDSATVSVTVNPVITNVAPVANDDLGMLATQTDVALTINASTLTNNDSDPGDTFSITDTFNPVNGTISAPGQTMIFTPDPGFSGTAYFNYMITDSGGLTDTATVSINVQNHGTGVGQGCIPSTTPLPQKYITRHGVAVCANGDVNPTKITLHWADVQGQSESDIEIYRRALGANSWGTALTPSPSNNTYMFEDYGVSTGVTYEYKIHMKIGSTDAYGYITSGINVPGKTYNGKVLVFVESSIAPSLTAEIDNLKRNLFTEGWFPIVNTDFGTYDAVADLKAAIEDVYDDDPNLEAVFLLGHLPVAYSGRNGNDGAAPDGHSEHKEAWPSDGYYGDPNHEWDLYPFNQNDPNKDEASDLLWQGWSPSDRNHSEPPMESIFEEMLFPSEIELQVGRVDMFNMPTFQYVAGDDEIDLIKNYLTKLHNFKRGIFVPQQRAIVVDQLYWLNFVRASMSAMSCTVGMDPTPNTGNLRLIEDIWGNDSGNGYQEFYSEVNNQSYLWGHGTGYGGIVSSQTIGTTENFATTNMSSVFNTVFGSYFGDWDMKDNFLRAFIAKGKGLTSVYSGDKLFYAHYTGMGETLGYAMRASMNNNANYNYDNNVGMFPAWGGGFSYGSFETYLGLMGDPTLRIFYPEAPTDLSVNANGTTDFTLSWTPANNVDGYHVYQVFGNDTPNDHTDDSIVRLNSTIITGTTSPTFTGDASGKTYMVRSVRNEVTPSGTYENIGLGDMN